MYHTGDTIYVNALINGFPYSLDLMNANATPIILTKMLHTGDTMRYNSGYLLGSSTLAYLAMLGAPSATLNVCIIVWGKGLAAVTPAYGGDVNTANNTTCVTHDASFVTSINKDNRNINAILVYPNPSSNYLNFDFNTTNEYSILLYDVNGKQVKNIEGLQSKASVNISNLNNGLYFYKVYANNTTVKSGKFIKE